MRFSYVACASLVALMVWGCSERQDQALRPQPPLFQFSTGQGVQTTTSVTVHSTANNFSSSVGTEPLGASATIVTSPGTLDASGDNTIYWQVAFTSGPTGWVSGVFLAPASFSTKAHFAVPSGGRTSGNGNINQPWTLDYALAGGGGSVLAGDTVYLRGGTYAPTGADFHATLNGTDQNRTVVRQYPGEHSALNGEFWAEGSYTTFEGFEILQTSPVSSLYGLRAQTTNGRFINLVIHDAGTMGISIWMRGRTDTTEVYGCIVYNNGMTENHDHGVYVENDGGIRILRDNVFFNNTSHGIHAYTVAGNPPQVNIWAIGNVAFNNGSTALSGWAYTAKPNVFIGAEVSSDGMRADTNIAYYSNNPSEYNLKLGYLTVQNLNILARGNTAWGGTAFRVTDWTSSTISGNTIWTPASGGRLVDLADPTPGGNSWSGNTYLRPSTDIAWYWNDAGKNQTDWQTATGLGNTGSFGSIPSSPTVAVRPNKYVSGRALIVVNNDAGNGSPRTTQDVTVNLPTGILTTGQAYSLHNVQDFYNSVGSGTYNGSSITITAPAMQGGAPAALLGSRTWGATPPTTGPRFNAFILTSP